MSIEIQQPTLIAEEETHMARLSPPFVPDAAHRRVDVTLDVPREGLRRNQILAAYYLAMPEPLPERGTVPRHLKSWSGHLGGTQWYRTEFPQTAILFADPAVNALPEEAAAAVTACNTYVDPLTRYTAGWVGSLAVLIPPDVRGPARTGLREVGRFAAGQVVRAMAAASGVLESRGVLEGFIADPSPRHETDERTALDAYLTRIAQWVRDIEGGLVAPLTPEGVTALNGFAKALERLGAMDTSIDAALVAAYREKARAALTQIIRENPDLLADDYLARAFQSVITTYVNKLVKGEPVDQIGASYVRKRIESKRLDDERSTRRQGDSIDEERPTSAPNLLADPGDPTREIITDDRVLEVAIRFLDADPKLRTEAGGLCWEAEQVRAEFASELIEVDRDNSNKRKFTPRVREAWKQQRPSNARSTSAIAASMDCEILLRTTLKRAQLDLENTYGGDL
ncbi:hypothetical protein ACFQNE_11560 [Gordonia phosphorivorans]|uniref:Uncharacterized protein n=1 Tax=Gordonia phosphorivorans TaxID=1056982 RepID=A0ABV6HB00_9ACTN